MTGWAGGLAGGKEGRKGVGIRWDGGWRCAARLQRGFRVIRGRTAVLRKGGHKRKKVPGASSREGTGGTLWTHGLVDSVGGACAGDRTCMCRPRSCRGRGTSPGRSRRCLCRSGRPSSQYLCTWVRRPPQQQPSQMGGRRGGKGWGATRPGLRTCRCRARRCRGRGTSSGRSGSGRLLRRSGRPSSPDLCTWVRRPPQPQPSQMGGRWGDKRRAQPGSIIPMFWIRGITKAESGRGVRRAEYGGRA